MNSGGVHEQPLLTEQLLTVDGSWRERVILGGGWSGGHWFAVHALVDNPIPISRKAILMRHGEILFSDGYQ